MSLSTVGWLPGSDRLHGRCHCGASSDTDDPATLWDWLDDHPAHAVVTVAPTPAPAPAHLVSDPGLIRRRATAPA